LQQGRLRHQHTLLFLFPCFVPSFYGFYLSNYFIHYQIEENGTQAITLPYTAGYEAFDVSFSSALE